MTSPLDVRFTEVARRRPVDVVQPGSPLPAAPYAAAELDLGPGAASVGLRGTGPGGLGGVVVRAVRERSTVALVVEVDGASTRHASRRHGRTRRPETLAIAVTGPVATAFVREDGVWTARAQVDLGRAHDVDTTALTAWEAEGATRAGAFGQLGLRDLRLVTRADGAPYLDPTDDAGALLLTATSAGPAGFRTGHSSLWSLHPTTLGLAHRADHWFTRADRSGVLGDHAVHLVRDDDAWLLATSTWGDFDLRRHPHVGIATTRTDADLTRGQHVLATEPLAVPTTGLTSVGVWDPHLVRDDDTWTLAYVSASRWFAFHPVVAQGPRLDALRLRAAAVDRTATEGPTLLRVDGELLVLASDGRDNPRAHRAAYPVLDLDLAPRGRLDAVYPTNLPWPTIAPVDDGWLLVGFDSTPAGGALLGYGTHGDVVLQRAGRPGRPEGKVLS